MDEASEAIRQAQLEITEERSQVFLAQVNEYMGKLGEAYAYYKSCLKSDPDNIEALAGIVNLLRLSGDQAGFEARRKEADVYIDRMIQLEPDPENPARARVQASARRMRAQDLATSNTYHDFVKALSLLEQNQVQGQPMATQDLLLFATLSASRNDGVSRDRAIDKLESIRDEGKRRLTNQELLILAELYKKQGRWQDCSSVMNNLLSKYPNDMKLLGPWLAWLVEADQLKLAERWLENANPNSLAYVRTRAHIWVKNGETSRALELLRKVLPKEITTKEQETLAVSLANVMEQMANDDPQLYPYVESIWQNYTRQVPEQSLLLAGYYGRRGSKEQIESAFKICQTHVDAGRIQETLPVALGILRVNQARIPIGSPYHERVKRWFDSAERAAPNSPALAIQRSEFDGLTGDFDAVEKNLRRYISNDSITPQQKATAYNNLAYVLALQGKGAESMTLVSEAVEILGPISDLRDTRAMVYLALDKPTQALEDLDAAIAHGGESAFKLFHKALAELKSGNRENALESMQKAIELGLEVNQLNVLEKRQFETLVSQLNIEATKPVSTLSP
jgi:tetratricopeptide (TPR) repeat protein